MKKIILSLFIFILLSTFCSINAQIDTNIYTTEGEATTIATDFLRISNISPSREYSVYSLSCDNHAALYEVVFQSGQSVIVAGHKTGSPISSISRPPWASAPNAS